MLGLSVWYCRLMLLLIRLWCLMVRFVMCLFLDVL